MGRRLRMRMFGSRTSVQLEQPGRSRTEYVLHHYNLSHIPELKAPLGWGERSDTLSWDPTVLRKYNTTGHFRLLNQVRTELKDNPLVRPQEGQTVAEVNRSRALIRATEGRSVPSQRASRRGAAAREDRSNADRRTQAQRSPGSPPEPVPQQETFTVVPVISLEVDGDTSGFRDRLNAVDLR